MRYWSIAAVAPGNITVEAKTAEEAIAAAENGEGQWIEDEGSSIKIVEPHVIVDITPAEEGDPD